MNLDLIAILSLLLLFCLFFIGIIMILVVIGSAKLKTEKEKILEDIEQMNYLKKYQKRKLKK